MNLLFLLIKVLNRLRLLRYFNFLVSHKLGGNTLKVPVKGMIGFSNLYLWDDYDYRVYEYFRDHIEHGTFIDIGANIGQTLFRIKYLNPNHRVICVEPNPSCVWYLNEAIKANFFRDVLLVPCAVFDRSGISKLFFNSDEDDSNASLITSADGDKDPRPFALISTISGGELDRLIADDVSFIKVDVEGAEYEAIQSLLPIIKRNKPMIYCEVLDAHDEVVRFDSNERKARLFELVAGIGYSVNYLDVDQKELVRLNAFPDRLYRAENLDKCNYIFEPRD